MVSKTSVIRTRVEDSLKHKYEEICDQKGISPSEQLRDFVVEFVSNHVFECGVCNIEIYQPKDYDYGAWKVKVELSQSSKVRGVKDFEIPKLPQRIFHAAPDYLISSGRNGKFDLYARIVDGVWSANLYSNGIAEDENETSIDTVKNALLESVLSAAGLSLKDL